MALYLSYAQFVLDFPEFADSGAYPQSGYNFWFNFSQQMLNQTLMGGPNNSGQGASIFDMATELFVAHNLVLEHRAQAQASNGADPGTQVGVLSSKSVAQVSASYDVNAGINKDAGHWNLTTYGTRLMTLFNMFGGAGVIVGVGCPGPLNGPGYAGPWVYNIPNPVL